MRDARVNVERCDGGQECLEEGRYDAIDMVRAPRSRRLKASVDPERCCGCHACSTVCPQHGIDMVSLKRCDTDAYLDAHPGFAAG